MWLSKTCLGIVKFDQAYTISTGYHLLNGGRDCKCIIEPQKQVCLLSSLTELILSCQKRVFWVNIVKSKVNLHYRNCSNLFGILRREIEFRYYCCQNSTKSIREKKKKVERENVEFRQWGYRISYAQFCCPGVRGVRGVPEVKRKKKILTKELWQWHCQKWGGKSYEIYERVKKKSCHVHNIFTTFSQ